MGLLGGFGPMEVVLAAPLVQERLWDSVELPANFVLDLQSGLVASRPNGDRPTLAYSRGFLSSASTLRLLPPSLETPRSVIDRDGGESVSAASPTVGQELVFDCFDQAWGYLRVLAVSPEAVTLEYVLEPDLRRRELLREPPELVANSGPAGVQLSWRNDEGAICRIERRHVPRGPKDQKPDWFEVTRVGGTEWLDDEVNLGRLTEYRVSREGAGGGFGSVALGVAGIEPPEVRAELGPGTEVNLLSAIDDGLRVDVTIEYVRSNGVQLFPGEGVEARILTPDEEESWHLPADLSEGYRKQRFVVTPGRVLAMRLPEGIYCLMRVEGIRDSMATISRQIDLGGERIFPPTPEMPTARWESGRGVVFEFEEPRKAPPTGEAILIVEREETLEAGDWKRCAIGAPGQRVLIDSSVGEQLLVRYRFRQGLDGQQISMSSEPVTVLVGGDSDEECAAMVKRAVFDLGSDDYDTRGRARGVLLALDEDAWPILKEALRSENPERASAARELLIDGLKGAEGDTKDSAGNLARLLISNLAEQLGSEMPPHPDWMSPEPGARALAALRGVGWRQTSAATVTLWRKILAEADPEKHVRQCASLAALLDSQGLGPDLGPNTTSFGRGRGPADDWILELELIEPVDEPLQDPWTELVQLQAWHELEASRELASNDLALVKERRLLARYLTAHFDRSDDELFLDCALRLIEDPTARLRGALDLAHTRRLTGRFDADPEPVEVVRLEAANTELLAEELNLLGGNLDRRVEFVLPPGIYEPLADRLRIVVEGANFRLRGEGSVELHVGFTLMKGCVAEFENLSIVPETGIAVNVVESRLALRGCLLRGGNLGLLGTDAIVELERSAITAPESAGPNTAGMRFGGRSMLLASESRVESAGVAIYGARAAVLDRCVVVSTFRNAIEGGSGSDLWLVNSLVKADKAPFARISQGVLDGAVLFGDVESGLSGANALRVCAEHLRCEAELSTFDRGLWLDHCTLGR